MKVNTLNQRTNRLNVTHIKWKSHNFGIILHWNFSLSFFFLYLFQVHVIEKNSQFRKYYLHVDKELKVLKFLYFPHITNGEIWYETIDKLVTLTNWINVHFPYPLKISGNQLFSDVCRGYRNGRLVWNGLKLNLFVFWFADYHGKCSAIIFKFLKYIFKTNLSWVLKCSAKFSSKIFVFNSINKRI